MCLFVSVAAFMSVCVAVSASVSVSFTMLHRTRCIACKLCEAICPAQAIYIEAVRFCVFLFAVCFVVSVSLLLVVCPPFTRCCLLLVRRLWCASRFRNRALTTAAARRGTTLT